MRSLDNEIDTWVCRIDDDGRLILPHEVHEIGWGPGELVVVESDRWSLRVLTMNQYAAELATPVASVPPS